MKVTFVNYYYDEDIPIDKYFDTYQTVYGWCKALSNLGLEVQVYHRFSESDYLKRDSIEFILVKDNLRNDLKWYQTPSVFHNKVVENEHDIIHINSFNYAYQASILKSKFPQSKIVIQHHAENPRNPIKRVLTKYFSSPSDGFIFSSGEIYYEWLNKKIIPPGKKYSEIMEGSSNFTFINRIEARNKTGFYGKPILLWVGRLNENKDPITVLSGFAKLLNDFPEAQLYMIYSEDQLKKQVLLFIEQNSFLKQSVILLGFIDYKNMESYYNSADYFVLGSHYEGSCYSLVEAMSCGVVPIVTDIPSFRMITNAANIGALWKCGDAESFYNKAKEIINKPLDRESKRSLELFNDNLSFSVIAKKAKLFYENLIDH